MRLKERAVFISAFLFVVGIIIGIIFHPIKIPIPKSPEEVAFLHLFVHNLIIILFLSGGGFLFALPTILIGIWNAFLAGALFRAVLHEPIWFLIVIIHGIPELSGQFCGTVCGFKVAFNLFNTIAYDSKFRMKDILYWFVLAVWLTFIAAILEWKVASFLLK